MDDPTGQRAEKRFAEVTNDPAFFNVPPEGKEKFLDAFVEVFETTGSEEQALRAGWDALTAEYVNRDDVPGPFEEDTDGV